MQFTLESSQTADDRPHASLNTLLLKFIWWNIRFVCLICDLCLIYIPNGYRSYIFALPRNNK